MRALLLDLYDTIAELDLGAVSAHLCRAFGVSTEQLFSAIVQTAPARNTGVYASYEGDLAAIATACDLPLGAPRLAELAREMTALSQHKVRLYDDVLPALQSLRLRGFKLAVVSNCDHVTRVVVGALGLQAAVDAMLLSCEVRVRKPDALIFQDALARLQVTPQQTVFVDDHAPYLDAAAALGMRTFQMLRAPYGQAPSRHSVVTDLDELCGLL